eukprot:2371207-Prorocentrum_lima.AAC.1
MDAWRLRFERACRGQGLETEDEDIERLAVVVGELAAVDIMEVFSPQRFTAVAGDYGLRPGIAID